MKRFPSIKKNSDFQKVYKTGKSYANRLLVMYVEKTGEPETRIGISVSKKVGNSVVRHHICRLVRDFFTRIALSQSVTNLPEPGFTSHRSVNISFPQLSNST